MPIKFDSKAKAKAAAMRRSGDFTLKEISETVGVSGTTLTKFFAKNGINKNESETKMKRALEQAINAEVTSKAADLAKSALDHKELHMRTTTVIAKSVAMKFKYAKENGLNESAIDDDLKALERWARINDITYKTGANILNIDGAKDENEKIESFEIITMDERDVENMRDEQAIEDMAIYGRAKDADETSDETADEDNDFVDEDNDRGDEYYERRERNISDIDEEVSIGIINETDDGTLSPEEKYELFGN